MKKLSAQHPSAPSTLTAYERMARWAALVVLGCAGLLAGCAAQSSPEERSAPAPIVDAAYLTADSWNDGQAEIAFYRIERIQNQYGEAAEQSFTAGTYLVKHTFDPEGMTKAIDRPGTSAFKYALFYEFESGSYQYKRNHVVNARQDDLRPYKQSFTSFDWCSNVYSELAFHPNGSVEYLKRSDDYGNERGQFEYRAQAYPVAELPLLVRGLDFRTADQHVFAVALPDGQYVEVRATLAGPDTLDLPAGTRAAERITVTYDQPVPSMIGEESDTEETYWRGTDPWRTLLQAEAKSGRYRMALIEQVRSPYWQENIWPELARVEERP